jgi:proliferating cell nuclear antigen PCNA
MSFRLELDKQQTVVLTRLIDGLRQHVTEASLECDASGVGFSNIDSSHVVALNGFLKDTFFSSFQCEGRVAMGINLVKFHQILKTVTKLNRVILSTESTPEGQQLSVQIQQIKGKRNSYFHLDDIEVDIDMNDMNRVMVRNVAEYPVKLELPTSDFKEIIDEMKILKKERAVLDYHNGQLRFMIGDNDDGCIEYEVENSLKADSKQIQVCFGIEKLVQIGKCVNLSDEMEIYLNDDLYPIYFSFPIGNDDGQVLLGLSPRISEVN